MWLNTGQEDGLEGVKGQDKRWLKMCLKTGREMVVEAGKDSSEDDRRCR
jgi:hypothetical protein